MHTSLKHKFLILLLLLSTLAVKAQIRSLSQAETADFKQKVIKRVQELNTLESQFVQKKHLDFVDKPIQASGVFYFKAPNQIRWEYIKPSSHYVIINDQNLYINNAGAIKSMNLTEHKQLKDISNLLSGTIQSDIIFDHQRFNISYHLHDEYLVTLKPKDKRLSRYISQIELTFDVRSYLIREIKIIEKTTDYTTIRFSNTRTNTNISNEKFITK